MPARGLPEGGEGALSTYIQPWIAFAESKYRKRNTRIHEVIERREFIAYLRVAGINHHEPRSIRRGCQNQIMKLALRISRVYVLIENDVVLRLPIHLLIYALD